MSGAIYGMGKETSVERHRDALDARVRRNIVGISVHTGNALRGYAAGHIARRRGAWVVYGGIHATLFPEVERMGIFVVTARSHEGAFLDEICLETSQ